MYTVKKLEPETVIKSVKFVGKTIGTKTGKHVTFAVMFNDEIVTDGKGNYEIYPKKSTAQQVADNYNSKLEK